MQNQLALGFDSSAQLLTNQYDLDADRGYAGNYLKHRLVVTGLWELPLLKQSRVLGGWSVSGIFEVHSGYPFGVIESNPNAIYPTAQSVRPNQSGPVWINPNWKEDPRRIPYFDTFVFTQPARFTFGNASIARGQHQHRPNTTEERLLQDGNPPAERAFGSPAQRPVSAHSRVTVLAALESGVTRAVA